MPPANPLQAKSSKIVGFKPEARSAIANGSRLHASAVDGRSEAARRFRDVLSEIISDLGGEGLSEGQRQLARRAALMSVEAERMEAAAVAGEPFDLETFGSCSDRLSRLFARLGLRRVARNATPTIADLIARHAE